MLEQLINLGYMVGDSADQRRIDECLKMELSVTSEGTPFVISSRIDETMEILRQLGLPSAQINARSALALLALLSLKPSRKLERSHGPTYRNCANNGFC